MNDDKFEEYALSVGMRIYEANCPCCTYFDEDTEIAYQAWKAAIESVSAQSQDNKNE